MPDRVSPFQPTLFEMRAGERDKVAGMRASLDSERSWPWREHALAVLEELAATGKTFTADDLVARVGLPDDTIAMNRNNAVGAIFSAAAKSGMILPTGNYIKSRRRSNHSAVLAVWAGNPERDF